MYTRAGTFLQWLYEATPLEYLCVHSYVCSPFHLICFLVFVICHHFVSGLVSLPRSVLTLPFTVFFYLFVHEIVHPILLSSVLSCLLSFVISFPDAIQFLQHSSWSVYPCICHLCSRSITVSLVLTKCEYHR